MLQKICPNLIIIFGVDKIDNIPKQLFRNFSDYVFENEVNNLEKKFYEMNLSIEELFKDDILIYKDKKIHGIFSISYESFKKAYDDVGFRYKDITTVINQFYEYLDYYRYK